ncbi:MAG: methyltransferase domain-containing protein [Bacteroidia bacterium]|nr:methyltransferase domain-containing protein [Bacteroidia bacterium]
MYKEISSCRICGNTQLESLIYLGEQTLTGVFPKNRETIITNGPLELVKCYSHSGEDVCGLVQLKHSFDSNEMYGDNYGYRSGLNQSMVKHLHGIVAEVLNRVQLSAGDVIIDIGGNDSTLLQAYPKDKGLNLMVIDPTSNKFKKFYPEHINNTADFFNATTYSKLFDKKAKVITSIAMFYDLEAPMKFVQDIYDVLDEDGLWIFEQSYLPFMVDTTSYDTICHEHLEYYAIQQIKWIFDRIGFKIVDINFNNVNGGSFRITAAKKNAQVEVETAKIQSAIDKEIELGYNKLEIYKSFSDNVLKHKNELMSLLQDLKSQSKKIFGYGASTKGNVLLQYCGITTNDIPCIAEVNPDKFGSFTPNTLIPIISEKEAREQNPDYFLVLPWHFRDGIIEREREFINNGGKLIFPLPHIEVISK